MDPAYAAQIKKKNKQLWIDFKTTVTSLYFSNKALNSDAQVHEWQGPNGIKASRTEPLATFAAAQKLDPDLEQHLNKQH